MQIATKRIETAQASLSINGTSIFLHQILGDSKSDLVRILRELGMDDHTNPRLPGPNPVSIERKDFEKLKMKEYAIAEKTDGTRFVMIFTRLFGHKICAIIDRSMNSYLIPFKHIPRVLFQGSIFDGELTADKFGNSCFILFDTVIVSGVTVSQLGLEERLVAMRRSLKDFKQHPDDPIEIRFKSWTKLADQTAAEKKIEDAGRIYHTDGVILCPLHDPVIYGRNFDMFKMKPRGTHTVDFLVMDSRGTIGVYEPRSKRDVAIGKIGSRHVPGTIVECDLVNGMWNVVGIRSDKNQANDMLTYEKTMLNVHEDIQLKELFLIVTSYHH